MGVHDRLSRGNAGWTESDKSVSCCIVGCGPAGAVLGLLLARAGVDVLVLEKHADFLRDFRGDTIPLWGRETPQADQAARS